MTEKSCIKFCKKCQVDTERRKGGQCKPCARIYGATWRLANREKACRASSAWNHANREKVRAFAAKWQKLNLEKRRVMAHNRRARKREAGGVLSQGLAEKLFVLQGGKCPCCKKPLGDGFHLDHIVPLALGGPNINSNMQLLRAKCNLQKNASHPIEFMQSRGFLL